MAQSGKMKNAIQVKNVLQFIMRITFQPLCIIKNPTTCGAVIHSGQASPGLALWSIE